MSQIMIKIWRMEGTRREGKLGRDMGRDGEKTINEVLIMIYIY